VSKPGFFIHLCTFVNMNPTPEFEEESTVYLKTDAEHLPRIVIGYCVRLGKVCTYELACGTCNSWHYAMEISKDKTDNGNRAGFRT
jgi:hypothetical protein